MSKFERRRRRHARQRDFPSVEKGVEAQIDLVEQTKAVERICGPAHVSERKACSELRQGQERPQHRAVPVAKGGTASHTLDSKGGCSFDAWGNGCGCSVDPTKFWKGGDEFGSAWSIDVVKSIVSARNVAAGETMCNSGSP